MKWSVAILALFLIGCSVADKKTPEVKLPDDMNQWTMKEWDRYWETDAGKVARKKIELRDALKGAASQQISIGILGL